MTPEANDGTDKETGAGTGGWSKLFPSGQSSEAIAAMNPFTASVEQRLARAMAELEAVETGVAKAEASLRNASATVRSKDRSVEVTVGAQGELTALKFLDGKYRSMAAAELAVSILESAAQARDMMSRRVMKTFEPFTQPSSATPELTGVDVDWVKIFGSSVLDEPDAPSPRTAGARLRDEINEDTEN